MAGCGRRIRLSLGSRVPRRGPLRLPPQRATVPVVGDTLPALDELVARVPPAVRGLLDDLFRAKFTSVRRVTPDLPKA